MGKHIKSVNNVTTHVVVTFIAKIKNIKTKIGQYFI